MENILLVRTIGDSILHTSGIIFPKNPTYDQIIELKKQIKVAKAVLIKTGGAGIAANQCTAIHYPYRFIIVGVFNNIPDQVNRLAIRYPNTIFPNARTMVNPEIITVSKEMQNFKHACLSMPCQNKCEVSSPHTITVRYQDPNQGMEFIILTLADIDAVVLWHELTHILDGKTYVDIALESLATNDINHIQDMIMKEQQRRLINEKVIPQLPELEFQITVSKDNAGISRLNKTELSKVLPQMTDSVLSGFLNRCQLVMPKWIQPEERNILYSRL